jgi:hypothetical protein
LRDLVVLAAGRDANTEAEMRARDLAATLVLNCSYWFAEHPDERIRDTLAQLANHCRVAGGRFEGITPDRDFRPRLDFAAPQRPSTSINADDGVSRPSAGRATRPQSQSSRAPNRAARERSAEARQRAEQERHVVVDAIPVVCPPDEQLAGMMEAVILMAECLNGATETNQTANIQQNDTVNMVASQVRRDHEHVSQLVACGVSIENLETLRSINDSQIEVLHRHTEMLIASGASPQSLGAAHHGHDGGDDEARAIAESIAEANQQRQPSSTIQASAVEAPMGSYRERVTRMFEFYHPDELTRIDEILANYQGNEDNLIAILIATYGDEPMPPSQQQQQAPSTRSQQAAPQQPQQVRPPLGSSVSSEHPELGTYRDRLVRFYEFYNPEKIADVDRVLEKFEGREEQMLRQLRAKYGDEPMPSQPSSPQNQQQQQRQAAAQPQASTAAPRHVDPTAAPSVQSSGGASTDTYRARLMRFYEFYNPEKISDVDTVLEKFKGREEIMIRQLRAKYGDEPMPPQEVLTATSASPSSSGAVAAPQPQPQKKQMLDDLFDTVQAEQRTAPTQNSPPKVAGAAAAAAVPAQPAGPVVAAETPGPAPKPVQQAAFDPFAEVAAAVATPVQSQSVHDKRPDGESSPRAAADIDEVPHPAPSAVPPPPPPPADVPPADDFGEFASTEVAMQPSQPKADEVDVDVDASEHAAPAAAAEVATEVTTASTEGHAVEPTQPAPAVSASEAHAMPTANESPNEHSSSSTRIAADIDDPVPEKPRPFPPMSQTVDPSQPTPAAMAHSDESTRKPAAASQERPKKTYEDDDFDAFLNNRLK